MSTCNLISLRKGYFLYLLTSEINSLTEKCVFQALPVFSMKQEILYTPHVTEPKYFIHVSLISLQDGDVQYFLRTILNAELPVQVIKEAINLLTYLLRQFYPVHQAPSQHYISRSRLNRIQRQRSICQRLNTNSPSCPPNLSKIHHKTYR